MNSLQKDVLNTGVTSAPLGRHGYGWPRSLDHLPVARGAIRCAGLGVRIPVSRVVDEAWFEGENG